MDEEVVTELIQEECTTKRIREELTKILEVNHRNTLFRKYALLEKKAELVRVKNSCIDY
jgi:lipid-A-disaccharide synthase